MGDVNINNQNFIAIIMFLCVTLISLSAVSADTQIGTDSNSTANLSSIDTQNNVNLSENESGNQNNQYNQDKSSKAAENSNLNSVENQNSYESADIMAAGSDSTESFSVDQIKDAASRVRNHVETNSSLPNYVLIGSSQISMPQFLELLTSALLQINSGNNNSMPLMDFSAPTSPIENIHAGNIYKAEYLKIANDVKNYMDSSGKTPDFAYGTSLGTCLRI